ncbi:FAD/FMN-containing dehydrogenase [Geosmithia morbida]|uniref:FAD/FMN-containing dehydrogenase n=1 Tax=Geosmithia morbida TaxID=1094350 RepID=A0A9P4YPM7_9HYPO|nr:FAD/FMN-containing dehydrogenase [Geosmithia morbida]KAF4120420.1 FAD/FMN-containing dehydrogenase [Geosmithia morbida]
MSLQSCLDAVCGGRPNCVAYSGDLLYQTNWVKPFNLDQPVTPAAVIRPDSAQDVADVVKCASEYGYPVQARSGDTWTATYGSGFTLEDLDKELHSHGGRAMAHGLCPSVGIGGHATVGGIGFLSRQWGLALDHILEVEVVTADGEIRRASHKENPDLFFGLMGAGASFGIITEFKGRTEKEPGTVIQYTYSISVGSPKEMAPVFRAWQDLVTDPDLDRRFGSLLVLQPLGAFVTGVFYGTEEEYEASGIAEKLPAGGDIQIKLLDWLGSLLHVAEAATYGLAETPNAFTSRSLAFSQKDLLDPEAIDKVFAWIDEADKGSLIWSVYFDGQGGAIADYGEGNSYPHRDTIYFYQSYVVGPLGVTDESVEFVDGLHEQMHAVAPNANTTYAGYIDPSLNRTAANEIYWGEKLPKLREVKKRWDSKNVFRNPQSVELAD